MDARVLTPRPAHIRWIAYTDADTSSSLFCALLFDASATHPTIQCRWTARSPTTWGYLFRNTARIVGLETLAILAFSGERAHKRPNTCLWLYIDSNNALEAIVRGDSPTDIIAIAVARIWGILQRFNIRDWFPRVRSKLNPSGLPTRYKLPPYPIRHPARFRNLCELFIRARGALRLLLPNMVVGGIRTPRNEDILGPTPTPSLCPPQCMFVTLLIVEVVLIPPLTPKLPTSDPLFLSHWIRLCFPRLPDGEA